MLIASCSCGWQSEPCTNAELANQAWENHVGDGAVDAVEEEKQ
jgi:hypothetical protein